MKTIGNFFKILWRTLKDLVTGEDVDFIEVDSLEETDRADGGFNSTGY